MEDFDGLSQAFLSWLTRSGAEISPKVQLQDLRHAGAGRGVVATQDIPEHTLLFRIPRSATLTVANSLLSAEIPAATFSMLGPWLSLILVMLYEHLNGPASNWAPYFAVLPNEFNTLMFWSDDELAELQASAVLNKIGKEEAEEAFREELIPVIYEFADIFFAGDERAKQRAEEMRSDANIALMHKMGSLIMAYAFDIEPAAPSPGSVDEDGFAEVEEDEALPKGMIPLADMLNADADRCNARLYYEDTHVEMRAVKPITAGEEVLNDYGALPRSDMLRRYGYLTDGYAQFDVVEIPEELVTNLATATGVPFLDQIEYLEEQDVVDTGYDITASTPFTLQESVAPELIILIETLLLTQEEFERLKNKGKLPKPEKITSKGAEMLHKIVRMRIAQYATTLEQDLQTQSRGPTAKEHRLAMARAVRIGEKQLLRQTEEALAEVMSRDGKATKRQRAVDDEGDIEMGGLEKKHRA